MRLPLLLIQSPGDQYQQSECPGLITFWSIATNPNSRYVCVAVRGKGQAFTKKDSPNMNESVNVETLDEKTDSHCLFLVLYFNANQTERAITI